ncbi:MAG: DNA-binding protein WhiA [Mycoplasmataceae bacterium]|nr:DNA-binding protein WhiA [Mycoplasmataceae bacterium]
MLHHTFSEDIKDELCHFEYLSCNKKAILSSFLTNLLMINFSNNGEEWELRSQHLPTIKLISAFLSELFKVHKKILVSKEKALNKHRAYKLLFNINHKEAVDSLQLNETYPKRILKNSIDKRAYLVGAFLSGGSIGSIDKSQYHLEIRSNKLNYLRLIQKLLHEFNLSITLLQRKNTYVLYIKKAIDVSDFLKIIGANVAMQHLEDKIIARDYYTNLRRMNNLDVANLNKTVSAGQTQIQMINKIRKSNEFKNQPDKFKFYCSIRLQNPEASLKEIVSIFNNKYRISITRTGINHYVIKIKELFKALL